MLRKELPWAWKQAMLSTEACLNSHPLEFRCLNFPCIISRPPGLLKTSLLGKCLQPLFQGIEEDSLKKLQTQQSNINYTGYGSCLLCNSLVIRTLIQEVGPLISRLPSAWWGSNSPLTFPLKSIFHLSLLELDYCASMNLRFIGLEDE